MLDISSIPDDIRLARGDYATVRSAHEEKKYQLQGLCGELSSIASQTLKRMQPDNNAVPDSAEELIVKARIVIDKIEEVTQEIASLSKQRVELKIKAWGK